jgi:hypothetical protein
LGTASVAAIVSMLITAGSLGLTYAVLIPGRTGNIIALISFGVFCYFVWSQIVGLRSALEARTPEIDVAGAPTTHDVAMWGRARDGSVVVHAVSNMAAVPFANNPRHRTDQNHANSVRAEITYLSPNKRILVGPIQGRWGETDQPTEIRRGDRSKIDSVNLLNNGASRSLDLLIKYPEDPFCYAYNNDSYAHPNTFLNPAFLIRAKRFFVQIRLKGPFISDRTWELEVVTKGRGDTYKIRYGGRWRRTENSGATKTAKRVIRR